MSGRTIRVRIDEIYDILRENRELREQVKYLQEHGTELLEDARAARTEVAELKRAIESIVVRLKAGRG